MTACIVSSYAEKLEDRYVIQPMQAGLLYFILPYEVPSVQKKQAAEIDVTYVTGQDSVRVNMSIVHELPLQTDSIVFKTKDGFAVTDFETFFINKTGKKYMHRYSCRFPYRYWQRMYGADAPFLLQIHAKERVLQYGFGTGKWEKEQAWMGQILQLADRNRQVK